MLKRLQLSPFIRDFVVTSVTGIATALALFVVTQLLAQGLGPQAFGAYSLSKRVLAQLAPFSTLGMGVAVARYIAMAQDPCSRYQFLISGFLLGVLPSVVVGLFAVAFAVPLSPAIFHSAGYVSVFRATFFMLIGYSVYTVLYAFYRGSGQMGKASLWQLGVMALGPLLIAAAYSGTGRVDWILFLMGALYLAAAVPLGHYGLKATETLGWHCTIRAPLKDLAYYALPRVPAGLALAGLLSVGPFLASYFGSVKDAGYLVVGQSVFMLAEAGISAFGLIVLPKAAELFSAGRIEFLRQRIGDILSLTIHVGLYTSLHLLLWADQLVYVWLGPDYLDSIALMRILAAGLIPYFGYILLHSLVDAIENRAINTYNLLAALIVTLSCSLLFGIAGLGILGLAVGTTSGLLWLGLGTGWYLWRAGWVSSDVWGFVRPKECLWLNAGTFTLAIAFKYVIGMYVAPALGLGLAVFFEGALFLLYSVTLRHYKVRWILQLEERIVKAGAR